MSTSPPERDESASSGTNDAITLAVDIADTTWRMFVPTIVLLLLGLWVDRQFDTAPWLMLVGIIVGIAVTVLLVRRQYMRIKQLP